MSVGILVLAQVEYGLMFENHDQNYDQMIQMRQEMEIWLVLRVERWMIWSVEMRVFVVQVGDLIGSVGLKTLLRGILSEDFECTSSTYPSSCLSSACSGLS